MADFTKSGTIVDIFSSNIFPGTIHISNGKISRIIVDAFPKCSTFIMPGFIDAHVHIESSMLIPSEFARIASVHGTVATVSDPHEIGNVLGIEGIRFMIQNGKNVPFHFFFGAPSCVPATTFETSGNVVTAKDIEALFFEDDLKYLSEVMNYPGVLSQDQTVWQKIQVAKGFGKPIDGHAPGLKGKEAKAYCAAGITTDHECYTLEEALDKISFGMHILIREGSAAKNYAALHSLIKTHPESVMFCSDDKHPDELVKGHINEIAKRAIVENGHDLMNVLRAACLNPISHYKLDVGLLREGDSADFITVTNLRDFEVIETYVKGIRIAHKGKTEIASVITETPNIFFTPLKETADFAIPKITDKIHLIQAKEGQLITASSVVSSKISHELIDVDLDRDILKLAVINRYQPAKPALAFVQHFGLKRGALASCIAHDSHNIIAVGCSDAELCRAVNLIIKHKGGIAVVDGKREHVLPLPIAGIMTNEDGYAVAKKYELLDQMAKALGTPLSAPFMTLSFMALLVIPEIKLSDLGLFDGKKFEFIDLQV